MYKRQGYNISLIAISDDNGKNWKASSPIVGLGPIQPSLVEKKNGHIIAYMRDSGNDPKRILKSISKDKGETWSFATDTKIPNPSSSVEVLQLKNGNWIMACNDNESNRNQMAILLSFNEGKSWDVKKYVGKYDENSGITLSYPSLIQSSDGRIHLTYSLKENKGKTIQHVIFNEDWIKKK